MTTKENILKTLKSNKLKLSKFGIRNVGLFGSYIPQLPRDSYRVVVTPALRSPTGARL
jgi:predicted nucleotidyltransferase